jgi:hypothetical protein
MEKITKEFCKNNILIFHPKTEPESAFIQKRLFDLGCRWEEGGGVRHLKETVTDAMVIRKGQILYGMPTPKDKAKGIVCTNDQFDVVFDKSNPDNLSDRELMTVLFNQISARLDVLTEQVEKLNEEIAPRHLQKDGFKIKQ